MPSVDNKPSLPYYDYTGARSAKFLKSRRQLDFTQFTSVLSLKEDIGFYKASLVKMVSGAFVHGDKEQQQFCFWYKKRRHPTSEKWPTYHIVECRTMQEHSGFSGANMMPVNITYLGKENSVSLKLCRNCKYEVFKRGFFNRLWSKQQEWYDVVLRLAEQTSESELILRSDGYPALWNQISEAYRTKVDWCCENPRCKVDLSDKENRKYLHTHHLGSKKQNSAKDLEALCLLCHAMEHPERMMRGTGPFAIGDFIAKFGDRLDQVKVDQFNTLQNLL